MENIEKKHFVEIKKILLDLSKDFGVKIIFAIESGSRLWGFHSKNSDYDIRFIYKYPKHHYLSISKTNECIQYMSEDKTYDIEGWEIKKFAKLLVKSNPASIEWIHSNLNYFPLKDSILEEIARYYFDPETFAKHHLSLCKNIYKKYIEGEDQIIAKKLLYCLKGYYSSIYVQKYEEFPPLIFSELIYRCKAIEDIPEEIMMLVEKKAKANEKLTIESNENLNKILESFINKPIKIDQRTQNLDFINKWLIETIN